MFYMGYIFLALIAVRIIHDITAFIVYRNHDLNRNNAHTHNLLYRFLGLSKPMLAYGHFIFFVTIAFVFQQTVLSTWPSVLAGLAIFHYTSESLVWKQGTIHRKSLALQV